MRRVTEKARLKRLLRHVRTADAAHEAHMQRVAAKAGMTLAQLRSLPMEAKDRVIFANRIAKGRGE